MLAIEPGARDCAQEELAAVGVGPGVGHGQDPGAVMLQREVLVLEHLAVYGFAAGTVSIREVAALQKRRTALSGQLLNMEGPPCRSNLDAHPQHDSLCCSLYASGVVVSAI